MMRDLKLATVLGLVVVGLGLGACASDRKTAGDYSVAAEQAAAEAKQAAAEARAAAEEAKAAAEKAGRTYNRSLQK